MLNSSNRNLNLLLDKLLDISRESGFSTEDIIKDARIDLSKPIDEIEFPRIIDYFYNYTKDEALMIKLGQRVDVTYFGSFGFALMSCSDFTEAIKLINRYQLLLGTGINFIVLADSNNTKHTLRVSINILSNLQKKLVTELIISQSIYLLKIITNNKLKFKISFQYEGINNKELYESILKCDVEFNQLHNEISIPIDISKEKLISANSAVHIIYEEQCERLLRDLNKIENFSAATRRILLQAGDDFPDIKEVAYKLHISESTLRRRLKEESSSYRKICDEVRDILAKKYLTTTNLTISDIAMLLNYSEAASFRRAFIRWNKLTPNDYRHSNS
ncbi:AraC family transcriptional regulator [Gammaproteobacteria bacterium]|jgi:AraC-like DNA-binding protein|nr:AraC family transcriptional regulator [Gammaproteobacteria bacterium]